MARPYSPLPVPANLEDTREMQRFLDHELARIAESLQEPNVTLVQFQTVDVEPNRPEPGQMVYAPAQTGFWNPGAGPGLYFYHQGAWQLVDIAKGFGGLFSVAGTQMVVTQTPQVITVFDTIAPTAPAAPYKVVADVGANTLSNVDDGLWRLVVSATIGVPSAQILQFGFYENGVLVAETATENANQLDSVSFYFDGTFTISAARVYDLRINNNAPQSVTIDFDRIQFNLEQMQLARV